MGKLTGSKILLNCLIEQGVDTIFGYPGGAILNVYDELYRTPEIKHILTSHEQGASHAADGYARATGKVGVCFATSGPGATNLVTGIATAYMDSVPMVAITCNVAKNLLGKDSFQEIDITGITMPITKHNYIVSDVKDLADTVREAFYIAASGRPGPVLIDIPKDVTSAECEYQAKEPVKCVPWVKVNDSQIENAVKMLDTCKKPFIISGGGAISAGASEQLIAFANNLNAPIASTMMGLGSYPTDDDKFMGMIGLHGTKASNIGVSNADLVIAIGVRFSDRVTSDTSRFAKNAKIIHIDVDPAEIRKNVRVDQELIGDAKCVLEILNSKMKKHSDCDYLNEIKEYKKEFPHKDNDDAPLNPEFILKTVDRLTGGNAVKTTEVGQNQLWTAQFGAYNEPRTLLTSGGLGTMGFGTGAAMGAAIGLNGKKRVVAIAGDGSFRMNCNELSTLQYYNIPVIIVIIDNHTLGNVRQWQTMFYGGRYSQTTLDRGPDFVKLADAYGIDGYSVSTKEEFVKAFEKALSKNAPSLIDAHIDIDDVVLPMVAPGKPLMNIQLTK